jgi:hypothetical protein
VSQQPQQFDFDEAIAARTQLMHEVQHVVAGAIERATPGQGPTIASGGVIGALYVAAYMISKGEDPTLEEYLWSALVAIYMVNNDEAVFAHQRARDGVRLLTGKPDWDISISAIYTKKYDG